MRIEVNTPNLPESVQDAVLLEWRKQTGDAVVQGETLVDLETDKVVLDVPAPKSGVLLEIFHRKGDVVVGGQLLAAIETEAAAPKTVAEAAPETKPPAETPAPAAASAAAAETPQTEARPAIPQGISPAVRRLLSEHGLDAAQIKGSGKDGKLSKQDILDHLEANKAPPAKTAPPPTPAPAVAVAMPQTGTVATSRGDRRVTMSRLRSRIAERMIESQRSTATLTTFNEVNMHKVFEVRNQYKARFEQDHKVKLGFMSFFVKAAVEALKRFPIVNAGIEGEEIVYHDHYDIGIAVSSDRGLVVPILRDADKLDFGGIEKAIADFSRKARDGKLSFEDLTGGTFTITNGGTFGSLFSTPILNPPQSGILGMHAIKDRPVVENGEIVIRPMIYLAFSYDHRLIDGREAVLFLYTIKELLEDPVRMVLNV
jgi:2-oxoglutarate dehydrogenase E2 component (dihydrolipoamide succinyltransferase)